ncbi:MAG TPA: hypothetical protein VK786_05150 [bacterium]|jgi:4'-phosphopantetheinyl transferase|nr:hypothetical protein [bacterium]
MTPRPLLLGLLLIGKDLPSPLDWTPEEDARFRGMGAPIRAAQYKAGRWLLRRLCSEYAGLPMDAIRLNAQGAPVAHGPAGMEIPHLSLSHSGDWVAATACSGPAGVDVERLGRPRDWRGLAEHLKLGVAGDEATVLRAWTETEARFKAGDAQGLALWRFESADYLGCLAAPLGSAPELRFFGGAAPVPLVAGR